MASSCSNAIRDVPPTFTPVARVDDMALKNFISLCLQRRPLLSNFLFGQNRVEQSRTIDWGNQGGDWRGGLCYARKEYINFLITQTFRSFPMKSLIGHITQRSYDRLLSTGTRSLVQIAIRSRQRQTPEYCGFLAVLMEDRWCQAGNPGLLSGRKSNCLSTFT